MTMYGHYRMKQGKLVVFQRLSENYREHTAKSMKVKQSKVKILTMHEKQACILTNLCTFTFKRNFTLLCSTFC